MREFRLPDPGEGLVEAEIVTWRVAVGDQVQVNDIVVEIETAKSLVELPCPFAGLVTEMKGYSVPMGPDRLNFSVREPLGVVGRIVPFCGVSRSPYRLITSAARPATCGPAIDVPWSPQ